MTGKELFEITKPQLNVESSNDYNDSQLLAAINSVVMRLNLIVSDIVPLELTVEAENTFLASLPSGFIRVVSILDSHKRPYFGWETLDGLIKFKNAGSYTVYYAKPFPNVANTSINLPFHDLYLPAIQSGIKSIFWEQEEEMEKSDYFNERMKVEAQTAFKRLQSLYVPNQLKAVRR